MRGGSLPPAPDAPTAGEFDAGRDCLPWRRRGGGLDGRGRATRPAPTTICAVWSGGARGGGWWRACESRRRSRSGDETRPYERTATHSRRQPGDAGEAAATAAGGRRVLPL